MTFEEFIKENSDYLVVSHSQIEKFEQCHRKWSYHSIDKLVEQKTWPMNFSGMMLHPALSRWYTSGGKQTFGDKDWQNAWLAYTTSMEGVPLPRNQTSIYSINNAFTIINTYINQFYKDFEMYKVVESETKRWKILPGMKAVYLSIPDLVLSRIGDEKIVVNDFKHSTWDVNADLQVFDRQLLGQAWVTDAKFLMKTHIHTKVGRAGENPLITITRPFDPVEPDQLSEWLDEVCMTADEIQRAREKGVFVKHAPKGCFAFQKKCEFVELCNLGSSRKFMIESMPKRNEK